MSSYAVSAAATLLAFFVLPTWIVAGLADYFCHRAAKIETTSGTAESVLHLVQFALIGLPVIAALFLDINAGFFLGAFVLLVLHHLVAAIDLVYANPKRRIAPREQMIHSVLEIIPITAFLLLAVIYWPQFIALFRAGTEPPVFAPTLRVLPLSFILTTLSGAFMLNLVPYVEELWRCRAHGRR